MATVGSLRYQKARDRATATSQYAGTAAGRWFMEEVANKLQDGWEQFLDKAVSRPGARPSYSDPFRIAIHHVDPEMALSIGTRIIVDHLPQKIDFTSLSGVIGRRIEEQFNWAMFQDEHPNVVAALKDRARDAKGARRVGLLKHAMRDREMTYYNFGTPARLQLGATLILIFQQATDFIQFRLEKRGKKTTRYVLPTDKALAWMEKADALHEYLRPYWLPKLTKPVPWTSPYDGGFDDGVPQLPVYKSHDRLRVAGMDSSQAQEVFDCLNTLQAVRWRVSPDMHEVAKDFWESDGGVADMPLRTDKEPPQKPADYYDDPEAKKAWKYQAWRTHIDNDSNRGKRILWARDMWGLQQFAGKEFHYVYQADWRGRVYPVTSVLSPQGHTFGRGMIQFAKGHPIETEAGANWLRIHGANLWGHDKVSYEERLEWVAQNEGLIRDIHRDPLAFTQWQDADSPWEFLQFCLEYGGFLDEGFGFVSRIPVQMDGTCNGLQVLSLLLRDEVGGRATNCTFTEQPQDIYLEVAGKLHAWLVEDSQSGSKTAVWSAKWLSFFGDEGVPRAMVKRPVMTTPYSVSQYQVKNYVHDWYVEACQTRGYNRFEKMGRRESDWLSTKLWTCIGQVVVAARDLMGWMQDCARIFAAHDIPMRWTTPVGFPGEQRYHKTFKRRVISVWGDTSVTMRMAEPKDSLSLRRMVNGVAPNVVHSLDGAAMMRTVSMLKAQGVEQFQMIHDSFGVPAEQADLLYGALRAAYYEIFKDDILLDLRSQWQAQVPEGIELPPLPEYGSLDPKELLESPYFFN